MAAATAQSRAEQIHAAQRVRAMAISARDDFTEETKVRSPKTEVQGDPGSWYTTDVVHEALKQRKRAVSSEVRKRVRVSGSACGRGGGGRWPDGRFFCVFVF